jgi:hypothetical protein
VRPGTPAPRASRPAWLDTVHLDAQIHAREIRQRDTRFTDVDAHLQMADSRLDASALRFGYAGGHVDLTDSAWSVDRSHTLVLHARADHLDVAQLTASAPSERRVRGRLSFEAALTGPTDAPDVMRAFSGPIRITGENLEVQRVVTPTVGVNHPLLSRLSLRLEPPGHAARAPVHVHRLEARLRADHGAFRTTAPLTADTDLGSFEVAGSVTADGALDLRGSVHIDANTIWEQTQHRLLPRGPVPVSVHVTGATDQPHIEISDLSATLRALADSGFRALGENIRRSLQHR